MSEEIYCAICHKPIEETLLLSCEHNLCIACAAENISKQKSVGIKKTQLVICDICKSPTEIDNETAKEILSIAMNVEISTNSINSNNVLYYNNDILNMSSPKYSNVNLSHYQQQKEICPEHGEVISYLCFDCLSKCICSECVVHGIHRNHEVINIKKAYPLICDKVEDLLSTVDDKIKELGNAGNVLERKRSELGVLSEKCKREIKNSFEEIRIKLNKKEEEILEKTESILQDNIQELNTYSRIIQSKIIGLNKIIDSIQSRMMRKDELSLINYYCENKNKILNATQETEINNLPDLGSISNLRVTIDKGAFDTMLNTLNALHFEITSMKGIEITPRVNKERYSMRRNLYGSYSVNNSMMMEHSNRASYRDLLAKKDNLVF